MQTILLHIAGWLTALVAAVSMITPASTTHISIPSEYIASPAEATVVLPEGYSADDEDPYPVLYLLHGYGGNNRSWSQITNLDSLATAYDMIIVCPDGRNSWYWDSPIDPKMQMESFIIKELIPHIDSLYNTRRDRMGRAITGLSMGGHGALWLAIRHQEIFGSAGSTSGGVDIMPWPNNWTMKERLGPQKLNRKRWRQHSVATIADTLSNGRLNIIFDCGTDDFFFKVNNRLDSTLTAHGVEHTYLTSPGNHNAQYWRRSIEPQMSFFYSVFNR